MNMTLAKCESAIDQTTSEIAREVARGTSRRGFMGTVAKVRPLWAWAWRESL